MVVKNGSALFRYYQRLPGAGSSASSSGITPTALHDGLIQSNTSLSNVPCTESFGNASCSQSRGMSICQQPRKRKADTNHRQRRRSNPAVVLLTADTQILPLSTAPVCSDSVVEVVALSSEGSTATTENSDAAAAARNRKGKGKLPVIEEVDEFSDEEFVPQKTTPLPKKNYDTTRKFQDSWDARLPWAELFRGSNGLFEFVKCTVCSQITGKPKILTPKWDTLNKHGGKRKATRNMANGIKKGQWYIANNCKHLQYERIYAGRNHVTVAQQLAVVKGERARKRIQFASILHLLQEGRPMLEYTALQPLLTFLEVPKLPRRHWSDNAGWELAECLHHQVQLRTAKVMKSARFFSVTCDEVTTVDNQSWISIHGYVCEGWERLPMLLSLERVIAGAGSNNLTTVIVNAVKNYGGLDDSDLVARMASFGADGVNSFQGKKTGVVKQLKDKHAPRVVGVHCMAHRTNLAVKALSNLPVVDNIEIMLQSVHAFFAHSPKRHLEFVKLAELMQSKGLKILKNIKTRWISMLSPSVRVMNEYRPLLVKMWLDSQVPLEDVTGQKVKLDKKLMALAKKNLEHLTDIQILLGLSGLLPLLRAVHNLMQFAQSREVFVCDYVSAIQLCIADVTAFYINESTAFTQDNFWDFNGLLHVKHDAIPMSWVQTASDTFDLNAVQAAEALHFTPTGYSIPASHRSTFNPPLPIGAPAGVQPEKPEVRTEVRSELVTRELYAGIVLDVKKACTGAAENLIAELQERFPASELMDAFGLVYPQYWLHENSEEDFVKHLAIIKGHYGIPKAFDVASRKKPKGKVASSVLAVGASDQSRSHSEDEPPLRPEDASPPRKQADEKVAQPILSIQRLDEQACMFKLAMKGNAHAAMQKDLPLNPLTRLWRRIEANGLLRNKLSEYMKVAELAVVTVLGSVEDERTFSTLSFMKNRLRNRLSMHLPLVVGMHAQEFYGLSDFPYDAAYDEWKSSKRKED